MKQVPIKNYEGLYEISSDGNVYNVKRKKYLTVVMTDRYSVVLLYKKGNRKMYYIHRLVADAFCEKKIGKNYVNHIDLDIKNNHYKNLEWVSAKENTIHYRNSKKFVAPVITEAGRKKIKELLMKKVYCEISNVTYNSITEFSISRKISVPQASMKLNGKIPNNLNARLVAHFKKDFLS